MMLLDLIIVVACKEDVVHINKDNNGGVMIMFQEERIISRIIGILIL